MTSKRRKEDVLNEFRRSELIAAARHVFGTHGFASATMEAIAKEADVAKGTVYLYYDSKRAIYEAAWRASMEELEALVKARVESAATLQEAIAAFVAARVEFFQARQDFFRMYVEEIGARVGAPKARRTLSGTMIDRQVRILEKLVAAAVGRGEVRPVDPAATALAVFDMTRGLVARHLLAQQPNDTARDVSFLTDLIWTGLRPARRKQTS
ncbi:MAG: TetR/AcrR family transcriptional regulator [Vicinamibacterales bacterium]